MGRFEIMLQTFEENVEQELEKRYHFIRKQVELSGARGVVVGISGGIDSACSAVMSLNALGRDRVLGVWMPAYSQPEHEADAEALSKKSGLRLLKVDIGPAFDQLIKDIEKVQPLGQLARGNSKARLRMTTLYAFANELYYLVSDTCNRSEIYIGYMTKGGDGLADFNPMASLTKHHVKILARHLGIPISIQNKPPTADLWAGQTDEQEMGFSYEDLDRYLLTGEGRSEVIARIEALHRSSEHKRKLMPEI